MESVRAQTYRHIEYIVVDGGSTDGTREFIEAYNDQIDRWVSEPDKGIYDAMNKGLRMATGDFVWFMNAGDLVYAPETVAQLMERHRGEDILYGDTVLINEQFEVTGERSHKALPERLRLRSMRLGMVVCHQALLVRRTIAPEFDLGHPIAADIDWTIRALKQSENTLNSRLILTRFLEGGFSHQNKWASWKDRFRILRKHFGLGATLLAHAEITLRALGRKFGV